MRDINIKKDKIIASILAITVTASCIAYCNTNNKTTIKAPAVTSYAETTVEETIAITSTSISEVTTLTSENTTIVSEVMTSTPEDITVTIPDTTTITEENIVVTEEVVETLPIIEATYIEPEPIVEYIVYKPSTKYVHLSNCKWFNDECYEITDTEGIEARKCSVCNPDIEIINEYVEPEPSSDGLTYVGYFGRVTYYPATAYYSGVCGGSGRTLLGYGNYDNGIRGSIASRSLYEMYGYNRNGRTTVYLEFPGYENMNGRYYVDDSCANYGVIDIFVWDSYSCPFYNAGVITANCYI